MYDIIYDPGQRRRAYRTFKEAEQAILEEHPDAIIEDFEPDVAWVAYASSSDLLCGPERMLAVIRKRPLGIIRSC